MRGVDHFIVVRRLLSIAIALLLIVLTLVAFELMRVVEQATAMESNQYLAMTGSFDTTPELVRYGRDLIEHTAVYLGPKGKVAQVSNGMNCQNCHLQTGTRPFAINYSAVASTYPKFRHRSGTVEGVEKRVNDCIERSLNGKPLPETSVEMKAMVAYVKWVGRDVENGVSPLGAGLPKLEYLDRAADPVRGGPVYIKYCVSCHGRSGKGLKEHNEPEWLYPPLWGANSYNTGAGLFRLSKLAAFVRANMPFGVSHDNPMLSVDEAWDVAAYISSMPRPHKEFAGDWPDISQKPVDHPFGPYADGLSEAAHKYGPFRKK